MTKDMAQDGKNQLNSPLKVGAIYTIGPYLFPHLLPELRRAAPEMPLYIEENYTANLRQKLRQQKLQQKKRKSCLSECSKTVCMVRNGMPLL